MSADIEKKNQKNNNSDSCLQLVIEVLQETKADDISHIKATPNRPLVCDNMIIVSGRSTKHVSSIADKLISYLKQKKIDVHGVEGLLASNWVLVDLGDIMVHIFHPESRKLYDLESMWT
ncbi:ribosome silencing factor [Candidatus Liberibacter americanus]|uniref:Ribosomal silencing factor RsfS n=1 Tax=Candidatus Liberibacter americanus str. Sao Paulo TaxID=1261131 RepID=U6B5K9_9HYPH|nr:ribosome silencing factor [Candidatus Liberibacter americanus]AHA28315.1 hypothetical protein lam_987 [Candidatus Liberibacter americanus str. Sao Paulo]EMS36606.1 Iojap protein [Candidatus Liberibacter americanus PW_SP]